MDTPTILRVIDDLQEAGVVWLGFTGGEPLLNPDIVDITAHAAGDMAVKLFTTGVGSRRSWRRTSPAAGLFSVAVSLDHWEPARHDASRRYPGAFDGGAGGHRHLQGGAGTARERLVGAEPGDDPQRGGRDACSRSSTRSGVDEAWLSEVKPSVEAFWSDEWSSAKRSARNWRVCRTSTTRPCAARVVAWWSTTWATSKAPRTSAATPAARWSTWTPSAR